MSKRPCSFRTVSDNGNQVHGVAAMLVVMKRNGGPDQYIQKIAARAAKLALEEAQEEGQRAPLRRIK